MSFRSDWTPSQVAASIRNKVIGQEHAIEAIINGLFWNRMYRELRESGVKESLGAKRSILITGPAGTGKTHLLHTVAELLGMPFVVANAKEITQEGYVGRSVRNICEDVLNQVNGCEIAAQKSLVFIDEIDKLALVAGNKNDQSNSVSGKAVLDSLLTVIEGRTPVTVFQGTEKERSITPKYWTWAFAGAAVGIDYETFASGSLDCRERQLGDFGYTEEFLSRIKVITYTHRLSLEQSEQLVQQVVLPKRITFFREAFGIELVFDDDCIRYLAEFGRKNCRMVEKHLDEMLAPFLSDIERYRKYSRLCLRMQRSPDPRLVVDAKRSKKAKRKPPQRSDNFRTAATPTVKSKTAWETPPKNFVRPVQKPRPTQRVSSTQNGPVDESSAAYARFLSDARQRLAEQRRKVEEASFLTKAAHLAEYQRLHAEITKELQILKRS